MIDMSLGPAMNAIRFNAFDFSSTFLLTTGTWSDAQI